MNILFNILQAALIMLYKHSDFFTKIKTGKPKLTQMLQALERSGRMCSFDSTSLQVSVLNLMPPRHVFWRIPHGTVEYVQNRLSSKFSFQGLERAQASTWFYAMQHKTF